MVKLFPVHVMKTYGGNRGIALLILNLGPRWRWVVSFTPRPVYPLGKLPYELNMGSVGSQSWFGHFGEEHTLLVLGIERSQAGTSGNLSCIWQDVVIIGFVNTGSSKKMDGIWNRYNLKSTRRIYTFCVLKCSEKFKVLDLPWCISICAPFVALETSKRNFISCHVFWIMSRVTVSMADVILSCRCWIFLILSAYTMFLMYPPQEKIKWREIWT